MKMLSTMLFNYLTSTSVIAIASTILTILLPSCVFYKLYIEGTVPKGIPWAGVNGDTSLCQLKSTMLAMFDLRALLQEEYAKDRPYLVATFMNGPTVVLPRDHIRWYKSQNAKGAIDFGLLQAEKLHIEYFSVINTNVKWSQYLNLVHRLLTKSYVTSLADVDDEVKRSVGMLLGDNVTEWKEIPCFTTIEKVISAGANRMVIGSPLCQDESFLAVARTSGKLMFPLGVIVQSMPSVLRPIVGRLEQLYTSYQWNVLSRHVASTANQLLLEEKDSVNNGSAPRTLMARYVEEARKTPGCATLLNLPAMQGLVGIVNVAALSATTINCTDILLNILSYHGSGDLIEQLRREAKQFLSSNMAGDALDSMSVMDSVCRESLRLENGDIFFVEGVVTQPLVTPRNLALPRGARVALPLHCIHRDPNIYPVNPMEFDPYRFCSKGKKSQVPAYEVSEDYLPFSFGPKACPGRWFAIAEIKIVLSRLLVDYDIKPLDQKPKGHRFGSYSIPSMQATISVKKRIE